jgi:histidinol-phosphate aminotransferase
MSLEKQNIRKLIPYTTQEIPYKIKLDANEGKNIYFPNGIDLSSLAFHLYPDNQSLRLRQKLSSYLQVPTSWIVEGNGSSELIELLIKTYVEPNEQILTFEPTFSMYKVYAQVYGVQYQAIPCNLDFSVDMKKIILASTKTSTKLIFLCSPNNPTGYVIPRSEILDLLSSTQAIVVVDEAYIEFSDPTQSVLEDIKNFPNLVVLRTFSKAFGLASIRLGYLVAQEGITASISKVKSPYHVNALTQAVGEMALSNIDVMKNFVSTVIDSRLILKNGLETLGIQTYPANGNFIWIQSDIPNLYNQLVDKGILIRAYTAPWNGYYRITVGTNLENNALLQALKEIIYG